MRIGIESSKPTSSYLPALPLFEAAKSAALHNPAKIAIVDTIKAEEFTYAQLLSDASLFRAKIEKIVDVSAVDIEEPRVTFLVPAGYDYVVTQWAIWAAGCICVPLCTTHPLKELLYTISDSDPSLIIIHPTFSEIEADLRSAVPTRSFLQLDPHHASGEILQLPQFSTSFPLTRRALIIYTSGTTSRPKGCVSTHETILCQATSLNTAWEYSENDYLIHVLPLHHIHGILNGLTATLLAGATVEMHAKFNPKVVWERWSTPGASTMFMGVPTVYSRLIDYFDSNIHGTGIESDAREGARSLRVMISGSAALPTPVKTRFRQITDQELLERYGMTEIGMALSCGIQPGTRIDGSVGWPLPGVQVRLVSSESGTIVEVAEVEGAIEVKGPTVFSEYWRMPEMTAKEFSTDGWFKTGDIAKRDKAGAYYIQGRASVDIIKTGGYKVSALEVERTILALDWVSEVAVIGLDDAEWGQRVAAIVKQKAETPEINLDAFRKQLKDEMAPYKVPTILKVVESIERNAMGKVNKKDLVKQHFS